MGFTRSAGPDGRVRTHEEFIEGFSDPASRTLDSMMEKAQRERAADEFDDDVSLVRIDFA